VTQDDQDHSVAVTANRTHWNEVVDIHVASDGLPTGYAVSKARSGGNRLTDIEEAELGPVDGLDVLHLQCHFGLDTLRLRRLGARVTGLDFAPKAIATARSLFAECGEPGTFVEGDVYDAPRLIPERFDLVFVSWGTICWLPDLYRWAAVVAAMLRPGGRLYFCDSHPTALLFDEGGDPEDMAAGRFAIGYPYFHDPKPLKLDTWQDYADPSVTITNAATYEWAHPVSDLVTALIAAGLRLDWLHEHDRIAWQLLPVMQPAEGGLFRMPEGSPRLPLSLSLSARKPETD